MVIDRDDLPTTAHAHELIGADHGGVPFSVILVDGPAGAGPAVHRHPYAEVFVLVEGEGTFRLGEDEVTLRAGQLAIAQPGVAHGFTNTGIGQLKVMAVHGAAEFETEWLDRPDVDWVTPRRG